MNQFYFYLYLGAWIITFVYFYRMKRIFDSGNVLILSFVVYAFCSVMLLNDSGRGHEFIGKSMSLFPLIYLYITIMISISPVLAYNQNKIRTIREMGFFTIDSISWIFLVAALIQIPSNLIHIREGLTTILTDASGGLDIYNEIMEESISSLGDDTISNLPSIIVNVLTEIVVLIVFFNLAIGRKKKFNYVLLALICILPFSHLANSQRGPAVSIVLTILVTYFALNRFYPKKFVKYAKTSGILLAVLLVIPFMAITHSRFDRSEGGFESSIYSYVGQENVNFNLYAFDNNGLRYGDRVCPLFKRMLGFDNVPTNFWDRRMKYQHLKINDEVFIGYVGDLCLDFGPIVTFIVLLILSLSVRYGSKIRNGEISFDKLLLLQFIMVMVIQGGMKLFPFADGGALKIIAYLLTYICLKIEYNNSLQYKRLSYD